MSAFLELEHALFGLGPLSRHGVRFVPAPVAPEMVAPDVAPEIVDSPGVSASAAGGLRVNVWDAGPNVVLVAEAPGLTEKDVTLSFDKNVLTLSGERAPTVPEGYTAHRRERSTPRFTRAIRFNVPVDAEGITAVVKNGLLTITLPKAAPPVPRAIPVHSATH